MLSFLNFLKKLLVIGLFLPFMAFAHVIDGGDDLFPWPWGSECPFPWQQVTGLYSVHARQKDKRFDGHYLLFRVSEVPTSGPQLYIFQFDRWGRPFAQGNGYAPSDDRVVIGTLEQGGQDYQIFVRSYARDRLIAAACMNSEIVLAATFCPIHGRKCLADANYVLEKVSGNNSY